MTEVATPVRKVQMSYEEAKHSEKKYWKIVESKLVPAFMDVFFNPGDPDSYYERARAANPDDPLDMFLQMLKYVHTWDTFELNGDTLLNFYTSKLKKLAKKTDVDTLLNNLNIVSSRLVSSSLLSSKSFVIPTADETIFVFFKMIAHYYYKNPQVFSPNFDYMSAEELTWFAIKKALGSMIHIGATDTPVPQEPQQEPPQDGAGDEEEGEPPQDGDEEEDEADADGDSEEEEPTQRLRVDIEDVEI